MKVCIYIHYLPNILATSRIIYDLYSQFEKNNLKPFLILQRNIDDYKLPRTFYLKSNNDIGRAIEIKHITYDNKIDAIISFLKPMANVLAISHILGNRKPKIATFHVMNFSQKYGIFKKLLVKHPQRFLLSKFNKLVAVSHALKKDMIEALGLDENDIEVIYNPINIKYIKKLACENIEPEFEHIFSGKDVLINVARLEPVKGHIYLLRAFRLILKENPKVNLVILGDGYLKPKLMKLAKELSIDRNVFFLGFHKNPFKFVKRSKVFLFSSTRESFGLAVLEAFALGIPCVAFKASTELQRTHVSNGRATHSERARHRLTYP